ncbi:MAG: hypothetical protein IJ725_02100 [Ruminococcus sp.]|nr:hypothetical protein [Ruminococcus sp.]
MYINIPNVSGNTLEELKSQLNSAIYKLNEQLNASFGEIEAKSQGYTGTIITALGEKLIFKNGMLTNKE